MQIYTVHL